MQEKSTTATFSTENYKFRKSICENSLLLRPLNTGSQLKAYYGRYNNKGVHILGNQHEKKRYVAIVSPFTINLLHYRKPFVVAWWGAAFPGFGHLMLSKYLTAFILIFWEVVTNSLTHLNEAIYLSMTGKFEEAIAVLDQHWIILYVCIYVFSIWDSYRLTIEMNKHYTMAYHEDYPVLIKNTSSIEINILDKKKPLLALLWSLLTPGLGNLYASRALSVIFILTYWLVITYQANVFPAIHFTLTGNFEVARNILVPQWFLFIPSIYCFSAYESYVNAVELNKFIDKYISRELKKKYQDSQFKMPI
jgi:TM2 domain-containing membrane protein YozV